MGQDKVKIEGAALPEEDSGEGMVMEFDRVHRHLFSDLQKAMVDDQSYLDRLMKVDSIPAAASSQGVSLGRKVHPFDFEIVGRFQSANVHHGRCIRTKKEAIVGLGFQTPNDKKRKDAKMMGVPLDPKDITPEDDVAKIDTVLNPLCEHSWQDTLSDVCEDYCQTGNGYLEVRRDRSKRIVGLHHIPAKEVWLVIEDHLYNRHYSIQSSEDSAGVRTFAKFGDRDDFLNRTKNGGVLFETRNVNEEFVSEVIHFRQPTSMSRWYGFPDWLSAVAAIELVQCLTQHEYDFFLNRGVPEFMLFILGQILSKKDRTKIETAMRSTIGLGNQHKSILVNLAGGKDSVQVQLEKLALDSKNDASQFASMAESLALSIVTAHGVPPLLAGIQIPGKLGAANEMVQAMQAFQTLVVGPAQRLFRQTLQNTLGSDPSLGLTAADLVLNTITDEIDVQKADTMARMRQTPQEAAAEGRDLDAGVKKEFHELTEEQKGELLKLTVDAVVERFLQRAAA